MCVWLLLSHCSIGRASNVCCAKALTFRTCESSVREHDLPSAPCQSATGQVSSKQKYHATFPDRLLLSEKQDVRLPGVLCKGNEPQLQAHKVTKDGPAARRQVVVQIDKG